MNRYHQALTAGAILLTSSNIAFAEEIDPFFELLAMAGIATIDLEETTLQVSPIEYDTQVPTTEGDFKSWTLQLGLSYVYPFIDDLETGEVQWFPVINPQINIYYLDGSGLEGDVLRFEDPDFNHMDYGMDYDSTRLMFDLGITLASFADFSIYAIGGAGVAWNEIAYSATEKPGVDCPISHLELASHNSAGFAYEFGGGITYGGFEDVAISLQYLYTGFDDVELGNGENAGYEIEGTDLDINAQSLLLGVRFAL
ncbi:MAG: hypothetical protein ABSF18_04385 [Gammaproteobacteria bacterium]|jgi:opacity protein-like surface antigen